VVVGAALGILDGLTSWFTPAVRAQLMGIVVGSTFKGASPERSRVVRKKSELGADGYSGGLIAGLLLAWGAAAMQHGYYFEIMLPGSLVERSPDTLGRRGRSELVAFHETAVSCQRKSFSYCPSTQASIRILMSRCC